MLRTGARAVARSRGALLPNGSGHVISHEEGARTATPSFVPFYHAFDRAFDCAPARAPSTASADRNTAVRALQSLFSAQASAWCRRGMEQSDSERVFQRLTL